MTREIPPLKKYVTVRIEEEIRNQLRLLAAWQQRSQLAVLRDLVEREIVSAGIPVPGSKPYVSLDELEAGEFDDN